MGSDLHMSPPTPDEVRIVRLFDETAIYTRHTDGIYGDTRTWTRQMLRNDPSGEVLDVLKETKPGARVVTMDCGALLPKMSFEVLKTPDRQWDREEAELQSKIDRAQHRAAQAWEEAAAYAQGLSRLKAERKEAGA